MSRLEDVDGIDAPFEKAMRAARRDDAKLRALGFTRLPTASRSSVGMDTTCDYCGDEITDEFFVGRVDSAGFTKAHEVCLRYTRPERR